VKGLLFAGVALFIVGVAAALAQLWWAPWSLDHFIKLEFTDGCLLAILVAIWFARREYQEYRHQLHSPDLDE
jgi:hypothetical protein